MLSRVPVADGAFAAWQMGYARRPDLDAAQEAAVVSLHEIAARGVGAAGDPVVSRLVGIFLSGFRDLGAVRPVRPRADDGRTAGSVGA